MTHGIGWFELGTDDPAGTERFYGSLFDWTFEESDGPMKYRLVTTPAAGSIKGGEFTHGGSLPNYAVFYVVVADVAESCRRAEELGATVLVPPTGDPEGLIFAHLSDPGGRHFAVYSPRPGEDV